MLPEARDEIGPGVLASERLEHVKSLRVFLLLVPFDLLLAALFVLLHHAVLRRLEFNGGDGVWLFLGIA